MEKLIRIISIVPLLIAIMTSLTVSANAQEFKEGPSLCHFFKEYLKLTIEFEKYWQKVPQISLDYPKDFNTFYMDLLKLSNRSKKTQIEFNNKLFNIKERLYRSELGQDYERLARLEKRFEKLRAAWGAYTVMVDATIFYLDLRQGVYLIAARKYREIWEMLDSTLTKE